MKARINFLRTDIIHEEKHEPCCVYGLSDGPDDYYKDCDCSKGHKREREEGLTCCEKTCNTKAEVQIIVGETNSKIYVIYACLEHYLRDKEQFNN